MPRSESPDDTVYLGKASESGSAKLNVIVSPFRCIGKADGIHLGGKVAEFLPTSFRSPKNLVNRQPQRIADATSHQLRIAGQFGSLPLERGQLRLKLSWGREVRFNAGTQIF